jgi:putative chitinase
VILTKEDFVYVMPNCAKVIDAWYVPLTSSMKRYEVDQPIEYAAFLATIAEESGELHFVEEIWGPTKTQLSYEGRHDLGNVRAGDGYRYRGRGPIEHTGRGAYERLNTLLDTKRVGVDLVAHPDELKSPTWGAFAACAFWWDRRIDDAADRRDFRRVTRLVNGGLTNIARREIFYERAKARLGLN